MLRHRYLLWKLKILSYWMKKTSKWSDSLWFSAIEIFDVLHHDYDEDHWNTLEGRE